MRRRAERLERAVLVTDKIWRLHQAKLSRIDNEISRLRAAEEATLAALTMLEPKLLLEHISTLAHSRLEMEKARAEVLATAREYGRRLRLTQKLHSEALENLRRDENAEQNQKGQRPVSSSV